MHIVDANVEARRSLEFEAAEDLVDVHRLDVRVDLIRRHALLQEVRRRAAARVPSGIGS